MFGRDWESAQATIVAVRWAMTGFSPSGSRAEFVADVQPEGGAPAFRATFKAPLKGMNFRAPDAGQVVRVRYHPNSRMVEFDTSDPELRLDAAREREQEQFDALAAAAPGTTVPAAPTVHSAQADVSAAVAGVAAASSDVSETLAAIGRAKAAGDQAEVERLKAEFARRAAEHSAAARERAGGAAPAQDPLQRLQVLADLRDRGVLSDAEFAAEKAKILASG